jgi:peroxiredoxin Q/BCP
VCSLRDAAQRLEALDAAVFAASLDDVAAQKAFAETEQLPYPVLSDPDGSVAAKYGVLAPGGRYARRVTFVVDPEGIVRHVDEKVDVATHGADLARVLERLRGEGAGR